MWRYFSDCLNKTSGTFITNANIFGKVYFPRLVVPISVVISNLVALLIQLLLLTGFYVYFLTDGFYLSPSWQLLLLPLLVAQMAALGLGCGIFISSMTTRYRDLNHLVSFGVQLWMYATPVLYPVSFIPAEWLWILKLNPMTAVIEVFRNGAFGTGAGDLSCLLLSLVITLIILVAGVVLFSLVEKKFMDTV
jgi:lipopolysaccharide transport system permease protein